MNFYVFTNSLTYILFWYVDIFFINNYFSWFTFVLTVSALLLPSLFINEFTSRKKKEPGPSKSGLNVEPLKKFSGYEEELPIWQLRRSFKGHVYDKFLITLSFVTVLVGTLVSVVLGKIFNHDMFLISLGASVIINGVLIGLVQFVMYLKLLKKK